MSDSKEKLFAEFPPVTTAEWEEVIKKDLKGADYEKSLVWKTLEGINVRPYYRAEDLNEIKHLGFLPGEYPFIRGNKKDNNNWKIRQDIFVKNIQQANDDALEAISRGANSLGFIFTDDFQLSSSEFATMLYGVQIKHVELNFSALHGSHVILPLLETAIKNHNFTPDPLYGSISLDPIGNMSLKGAFNKSEELVFDTVKELVSFGKEAIPTLRIIAVNGIFFNHAGASCVQELGLSLAVAVEYLNRLTDRGLSVDDISPRMTFNFGVGSNYFMEIAKIRAARILWAKIVEAYQPKDEKSAAMYIHSSTSEWNMTTFDPHVNMLRATTESMSAAIGGTDSLSVNAFDKPFKNSDQFSNRIARNTQILLKEEAYFDKIADPSAGSYYIENLTASIANEAWKLFNDIQNKGGYLAAFKEGFVQKMIEDIAQKRDLNIALRREILLGTNQFPNINEKVAQNIDWNVYNATIKNTDNEIYGKPLKMYRGAKAFEELRLATEKSGKRPRVIMFPIGNLAMRKARAMFSCNFFACAGFEVIDNNGFSSVEEGVKYMLENKADVVVICSSDDEYAILAPEIFNLLSKKAMLVIAGAPACAEELKTKGLQHFISVKSNVLETLKQFQSQLI